jgi:hypothetical protein
MYTQHTTHNQPGDIQLRSLQNGASEPVRRDNWAQAARVASKHGLRLPAALVAGAMQEKAGAAVALLELLYEQLTGKK